MNHHCYIYFVVKRLFQTLQATDPFLAVPPAQIVFVFATKVTVDSASHYSESASVGLCSYPECLWMKPG